MMTFDRRSFTPLLNGLATGLAIGLALVATACAPANPTLQSPPLTDAATTTLSTSVAQNTAPRKVDVLFVIDTSESMDLHQENLKKNIGRFVDSFIKQKDLDFHIGVVSIWDSVRYDKVVKAPYEIGKLRPLKDPAQPGVTLAGPQYVTRNTPNLLGVLGETLDLGIEPRYLRALGKNGKLEIVRDANHQPIDAGGPEFEELFSPVLPALTDKNGDFYRKDAHLAVIMVTDADDSSPDLTADLLAHELFDLKGGDHNMVAGFGALSLDNCPVDPGREVRDAKGNLLSINPPTNINDFVTLTGGQSMNLCDGQFGDRLAAIGQQIHDQTNSDLRIQLKQRPDLATLKVSYVINGVAEVLTPGDAYSYIEDTNEIVVHGDGPVFANAAGGNVEVEFTPINWARSKSGHIVHVGNK